jgi:hypothetical protein
MIFLSGKMFISFFPREKSFFISLVFFLGKMPFLKKHLQNAEKVFSSGRNFSIGTFFGCHMQMNSTSGPSSLNLSLAYGRPPLISLDQKKASNHSLTITIERHVIKTYSNC